MPRKVLIITYYWPPSGGAGVQRWLKFVKYLRKYDWEPVIYTPLNPEFPAIDSTLEKEIPENIQIIQTPIWEPYQLYKKIIGASKDQKVNASGFISEKKVPGKMQRFSIWLRGNFFIPDARKFWIKPSVKFLSKWLQNNQIDAIVSTGPPHSMHMIANALKEKTGIPWIADFRDPWTNIDFYHELYLTKWADKKHHELELDILNNADVVVVVSESMKTDFLKIKQRDYTVITNGFDRSDTDHIKVPVDTYFSVAHIGSMARTRNPENLWIAMKELTDSLPGFANDLVINLVGSVDYAVIDSINKHGLGGSLKRIEYQPHDKIIEIQKRSAILLLIINDTPNAKVILPGKLFEYMASGRPILCIGPYDGDSAKVISSTNAGKVIHKDDLQDMVDYLRKAYLSFKNSESVVDTRNIDKYSREQLTGEMAQLLNKISAKN